MAAIFNPTIIFFILGLSVLCFIDAQKVGFSVELIHRDSPKSPLYNASETTSDRAANALRRSFNRVRHFKPSSVSTITPEAYINAGVGQYLMKISIGTPPFDTVAIADTGSDLIWTQCQPCSQCFKQDAPLFNPSDSSTYKRILCRASECSYLEGHSCSVYQFCQYSVSYEDKSSSNGEVATDILTLPSTTGRPVVVPRAIIGCGQHNDGTFDEKTSGIIGLGGGTLSLISQLGSSIDGKFSYCLSPLSTSKMHFGSDANVLGAGAVSTPLTKPPSTHYFLTLEAVSVGNNRINFTGSPSQRGDRNILIDSGTTYTLLPKKFYAELESAVSSQINARRVTGPKDLSLCYEAQSEFTVPDITVHFTDADVKLQPLNTFHKVSETVSCFTFTSAKDTAIYGNLAQMNFLVGYDTKKQTVSFKPTDCSTY
ncbi:hypothetical protein DITRI_Ditri05aG0080000 [Diplodiscus trichospermus]